MSEEEQKKIFSNNLYALLARAGKTQKEVADALNILPTTFNTWCTGAALPRMGKVQILADYFGIKKSDLLEDRISSGSPGIDGYYLDKEAAEIAQAFHDKPGLRVLFSAAKDASAETLEDTYEMLMMLKKREDGDTE